MRCRNANTARARRLSPQSGADGPGALYLLLTSRRPAADFERQAT